MSTEHNRRLDAVLAPRSSTTRRQWWFTWRVLPAIPCAAVALRAMSTGEWGLVVLLALTTATILISTATSVWVYRSGYFRGSLQTTLDHAAQVPFDILQERRAPHPADPMPPEFKIVKEPVHE